MDFKNQSDQQRLKEKNSSMCEVYNKSPFDYIYGYNKEDSNNVHSNHNCITHMTYKPENKKTLWNRDYSKLKEILLIFILNQQINPSMKSDLNEISKNIIQETLEEIKEKYMKGIITESMKNILPNNITIDMLIRKLSQNIENNAEEDKNEELEETKKEIKGISIEDMIEIIKKLSENVPNEIINKETNKNVQSNSNEDIKKILKNIDIEQIANMLKGISMDDMTVSMKKLSEIMPIDVISKQMNQNEEHISNEDMKRLRK